MNERWLVAVDLDGTLFDHSLQIAPPVQRAIRAVQRKGHALTLATGRMYRATRPFAEALKIDLPLICYQGALLRNEARTFAHWTLPLPIAHEVIALAEARDIAANLYIDDRLFVAEPREENEFYGMLSRNVTIESVGPLSNFMAAPPTKIVLIVDEKEVPALLDEATARWGGLAQVVRSHARFVELTHSEASKGNALRHLAADLEIPMARTMAIGDNLNDLSMVQAAQVGVAMGNADPALKAVADRVVPSLSDHGLAVALDALL